MDGVIIAGISGGVPPTIAILLLAVQVGRWQGGVDKMLENHKKWIEGQEGRCKSQKESCEKRMDYMQGRINKSTDGQ